MIFDCLSLCSTQPPFSPGVYEKAKHVHPSPRPFILWILFLKELLTEHSDRRLQRPPWLETQEGNNKRFLVVAVTTLHSRGHKNTNGVCNRDVLFLNCAPPAATPSFILPGAADASTCPSLYVLSQVRNRRGSTTWTAERMVFGAKIRRVLSGSRRSATVDALKSVLSRVSVSVGLTCVRQVVHGCLRSVS